MILHLILLMSLSVGVASDTVVLRDGLGEQTGRLLASDDGALRLQVDEDELVQIPWDQIREIRMGDGSPLQDQLRSRLERARKIWRARSRLQRGDHALAEPLFAELFKADPGRVTETDLIIAEGLLRCRLERGAMEDALVPALEVSRLLRLGVRTNRYSDLVPVADAEQPLCHYLPPIWVDDSKISRLIRDLNEWRSGGDAGLSKVADQYGFLLRNPAGLIAVDQPLDSTSATGEEEIGSELLLWSMQSREDRPDVRRRTRQAMKTRLGRCPDWERAWLHFLLGMSLLQEDGDGLRRQGLVQLAWLPARYANEQPYLSGIAMAIMARELAREGDVDSARLVIGELREQLPNHPVFSSPSYRLDDWMEGDTN